MENKVEGNAREKRENRRTRNRSLYIYADGQTDMVVPGMKRDLDDRRGKLSAFITVELAGTGKIPRCGRGKRKLRQFASFYRTDRYAKSMYYCIVH
jgi:hypothetical protein